MTVSITRRNGGSPENHPHIRMVSQYADLIILYPTDATQRPTYVTNPATVLCVTVLPGVEAYPEATALAVVMETPAPDRWQPDETHPANRERLRQHLDPDTLSDYDTEECEHGHIRELCRGCDPDA